MKKTVAIIGSGPAALMVAAELNSELFDVTIYEKNASPGRKFLVAGNGGFNLSHAEPIDQFVKRYSPSDFLDRSLHSFSNLDLRNWLAAIGIPTYVGSSNRIFPEKPIKPKEVLNAFLKKIKENGTTIKYNYTWVGWHEQRLLFQHGDESKQLAADLIIFALGGSSWKKTGSDGHWVSSFINKGIEIIPFQASNCAFQILWEQTFREKAQGKWLKNITLKCGGKEKKGEVVITDSGLEGGAIYALSPEIRAQLQDKNEALVYMDLKPTISINEVRKRIVSYKSTISWTKHLEEHLNLSKVQISLLKTSLSKEEFLNPEILVERIKNLPIVINSMAPIDEAISTAGGIALHEVDRNYQLKKLPDHYAIGEMLDWDAPTGGYLLQACFSMGKHVAQYLNGSLGK